MAKPLKPGNCSGAKMGGQRGCNRPVTGGGQMPSSKVKTVSGGGKIQSNKRS